MNNVNAHAKPLALFEGEEEFFRRRGFARITGAGTGEKNTKNHRGSYVDVWCRAYVASPDKIRMTIQRPKLLHAPWQVYGIIDFCFPGPGKPFCVACSRKVSSIEGYDKIGYHIKAILRGLRKAGKDYVMQHVAAGQPEKSTGTRKLTQQQADEIRATYASGGVTQADLAAHYGITQTSISAILLRKSYK